MTIDSWYLNITYDTFASNYLFIILQMYQSIFIGPGLVVHTYL